MPIACTICIATKGLRGCEIDSLPKNDEELMDHMEKVHHMPVVRKGETHEQAGARFIGKYPEAKDCSECKEAGAPWAKEEQP